MAKITNSVPADAISRNSQVSVSTLAVTISPIAVAESSCAGFTLSKSIPPGTGSNNGRVIVPSDERFASELTRRDLAYVVFKRKHQIVSVFVTTTILVTIGVYISPRSYVASATAYVVRNLSPIAAAAPTTLNIPLDRKEVLNSELDLISSKAVAEQVAASSVSATC